MKLCWPWPQKMAVHPAGKQNAEYFSAFDPNRAIGDYEFVVFDTELTGLSPRRDEIVSIGAVRIKELQIIVNDYFYSHSQTIKTTYTAGTFIHRITPDEARKAPTLDVVIPAFVEFCGAAALVGHFVNIDIPFLEKACRKIIGGIMKNPCLDSIRLAKVYDKGLRKKSPDKYKVIDSHNLRVLAEAYNLPLFQQHNALADALQTAYLFIFLVKSLGQEGLETFGDFYRAGRYRRWLV